LFTLTLVDVAALALGSLPHVWHTCL
jgi:hypothetical protein